MGEGEGGVIVSMLNSVLRRRVFLRVWSINDDHTATLVDPLGAVIRVDLADGQGLDEQRGWLLNERALESLRALEPTP